MSRNLPVLAFFGHHKCATKYTLAILKSVCCDCGLRLETVSSATEFDQAWRAGIETRRVNCLAYTNAHWSDVQRLPNFRGFHVIRDPRDVLVSAYFSHLYSHDTKHWPELTERREMLRSVDKHEGLMLEIEFCQPIFQALSGWQYGTQEILEVRFEHLIANPYQTFLDVFEHLGFDLDQQSAREKPLYLLKSTINRAHRLGRGPCPFRLPTRSILAGRVLATVYANRFEKKANGRNRGDESIHHHYRKGVPGDWKNHLTPEHLAELNRRYGNLMTSTGYAEGVEAAA